MAILGGITGNSQWFTRKSAYTEYDFPQTPYTLMQWCWCWGEIHAIYSWLLHAIHTHSSNLLSMNAIRIMTVKSAYERQTLIICSLYNFMQMQAYLVTRIERICKVFTILHAIHSINHRKAISIWTSNIPMNVWHLPYAFLQFSSNARIFMFTYDLVWSTMHHKFNLTRVRTQYFQIMIEHFMFLWCPSSAIRDFSSHTYVTNVQAVHTFLHYLLKDSGYRIE